MVILSITKETVIIQSCYTVSVPSDLIHIIIYQYNQQSAPQMVVWKINLPVCLHSLEFLINILALGIRNRLPNSSTKIGFIKISTLCQLLSVNRQQKGTSATLRTVDYQFGCIRLFISARSVMEKINQKLDSMVTHSQRNRNEVMSLCTLR